jgi:hypothetical protein
MDKSFDINYKYQITLALTFGFDIAVLFISVGTSVNSHCKQWYFVSGT